jgi:hypothetical protein
MSPLPKYLSGPDSNTLHYHVVVAKHRDSTKVTTAPRPTPKTNI